MNTTELKFNLFQVIDRINDNAALQAALNLLSKANTEEEPDWWDELSEEDKQAMKISHEQIKRGEVVSHEEVMAKAAKLLGKA